MNKKSVLTIVLSVFLLSMRLEASLPVPQPTFESNELKILSWNIYMLPYVRFWSNNRTRAKAIAKELTNSDYHIIVFQEAFSSSCRHILSKALKDEFPYQYGPANRTLTPFRINSGLWVISKIPLIKAQEIRFSGRKGFDVIARKGAVLFEGQYNNSHFQLVATHLQSANSPLVREHQCQEIKEHLLNAYYKKNVPQLICGDFNIDRSDHRHYMQMLHTLDAQNEELSDTLTVTYDEINNNLARVENGKQQVLDYILVRNEFLIGNIKRNVRKFFARIGNKSSFLSDHYAMEVNVIFKNKLEPDITRILP